MSYTDLKTDHYSKIFWEMNEKVKGKLPNDGASTRKEKKIVCLEKKATLLNTTSTSERRSLLLFGS
jgi:hypothetical protein